MEVDTVTSTTVTLQWDPPKYPNGAITKYSVYYDGRDIDDFGGATVDRSDKMTGTIEGLSPDTVYVLEMKAYTRLGPGPPISLPVKTRKSLTNGIQ